MNLAYAGHVLCLCRKDFCAEDGMMIAQLTVRTLRFRNHVKSA